jgi:hypothetical protein
MTTAQDTIKMESLSSERIDKRRLKRYGLQLNIYMDLGSEKLCTQCIPRGVPVRLQDIAPDLPHCKPGPFYGSGDWDDCPTCGSTQHIKGVRLHFWLPAEKPSEILSESRAQKFLAKKCVENHDDEGQHWFDGSGGDGYRLKPVKDRLPLEEILRQRIIAKLAEVEANVVKADIAQQASRLVGWLRTDSDKKARENIGWEAKLEALEAELVAEQKLVLEKMVAEELQKGCDDSEEDWHPRAIELASEKASEHLPAAIPSGFRMSGHKESVQPEDV